MSHSRIGDWGRVLPVLALFGLLSWATAVNGVFTLDEDHQLVSLLALREGGLRVTNTAGLPPSKELNWFDPALETNPEYATPLPHNVPPFHAILGLPFLPLGWNGLVAMQLLSLLALGALLFRRVLIETGSHDAAWAGLALLLLGSPVLEYAQGIWPHMLSALLVFAAFDADCRSREPGANESRWLAAAGLFAGLATGVRYPNILVIPVLGLVNLARSGARVRRGTLLALGALPPLLVCSAVNHARLGSWNPITKGGTYSVAGSGTPSDDLRRKLLDPVIVVGAKLFDSGLQPDQEGHHAVVHAYVRRDAESGALLIAGTMKKACLQSAPWLVLALLACLGSLRPGEHSSSQTALRSAGLLIGAWFAAFAAAGPGRTEGLAFNQRYLVDLWPLFAFSAAVWLRSLEWHRTAVLIGLAVGGGMAAMALGGGEQGGAVLSLLRWLPLGLAGLTLALALTSYRRPGAISAVVGLGIGWAFALHLGSDVAATDRLRARHADQAEYFSKRIPDHAAVIAYWGNKDAFGPLLLDRDLVIVDPWADEGRTTPALVARLKEQGRRVFIALPLPPAILSSLSNGYTLSTIEPGSRGILELTPP